MTIAGVPVNLVDDAAELRAYIERSAMDGGPTALPQCPFPDEAFVSTWRAYEAEAREAGAAHVLARRLIQLRFPVERGMSATAEYQAAVRRGQPPATAAGMQFRAADELRITLHQTAAGHIPVISTGAREDFVTLVQALTRRNEPDPVPDSMGACVVAGYNNWDRIAAYRRFWGARRADRSDEAWTAAFTALVPRRSLYQDRFIILSNGPYSGVPASQLGLTDQEWRATSYTLRLEHECAHYFTRRVLGSMRNTLLDELLADYTGLVAATGSFDAAWCLRFFGLEDYPRYRPGGRLQNYRGTPPLSDDAFVQLQELVVRAARNLEHFDRSRAHVARGLLDRAVTIMAIARVGLDALADAGAPERLAALVAELSATSCTV